MTLVLAMLLDALLGEPRWLWSRAPHPAVIMGHVIGWCDRRFNTGALRRAKGTVIMIILWITALVIGCALTALPGIWAEVILGAMLLAQKSLCQHVAAVADALRLSLGDGRRSVAMIVGRDTAQMDASDVARSAIESAAENLSDGITAPVFWFAIGGLPGLLIYKITNTADSMIGYLTPKHAAFGWAAARSDDLLNWVPARLTAALIWLLHPTVRWGRIRAEAAQHRSPNAGWPEAAMAYACGIALSGPRRYHGQLTQDAFVNPRGRRSLSPADIDASIRILWQVWAAILCLALIWGLVAAAFAC